MILKSIIIYTGTVFIQIAMTYRKMESFYTKLCGILLQLPVWSLNFAEFCEEGKTCI